MPECRDAIWDRDLVFSLGLATTLSRAPSTGDDPRGHVAWAREPGTHSRYRWSRATAGRAAIPGKNLAIVVVIKDETLEVTQTIPAAAPSSLFPRNSSSNGFTAAVLAGTDDGTPNRLPKSTDRSRRTCMQKCELGRRGSK